ncbi:MAG: hydrogenase maturation nickel metallochaperone HypA [Chloroflexota bacterium]
MHEASVAQAVLDTVLETAARGNARSVIRLEIEVGEICLVNAEQLVYFLNLLAADTIARDMKTSIKEVKTKIKCHNCDYSGEVAYREVDPAWHYRVPVFDCVRCQSNQTEIVQGRELVIKSIDIDN